MGKLGTASTTAAHSPRTRNKDKNGHLRGRPALPEESVRKSITFRMNEDERKLIKSAAEDMTLTETAWMRRALIMAAKKQLNKGSAK
jgi:hypothetical protein